MRKYLSTHALATLPVAVALALCGAAATHADVIIIGGLSNFDTPNNTGGDCNEFDIEFEGPHPEDVYHTYANGNYGPPRIESLPGNIGIRVIYDTPTHATHASAIEHFGVSLRGGVAITAQRFQWIPGTVGIPNPPPPPPPPPPLPMPIITAEVQYTVDGVFVHETVQNLDTYGRTIWVQRHTTQASREVALEELMPDDPLIATTTDLDIEPLEVLPGATVVNDEEVGSIAELASLVVVYDILENHPIIVGGEPENAPGALINTLLAATITQSTGCPEEYLPYFTQQPVSASAPPGDGQVEFTVDAAGLDAYGDVVFQWKHEGVDLPHETDPVLQIDVINSQTAGAYNCVIHNDCGMVMSDTAYLSIDLPTCPGDIDGDRGVDLQDLAILLTHFGKAIGATPADGDLNGDGRVDLTDLAMLLTHFGTNC